MAIVIESSETFSGFDAADTVTLNKPTGLSVDDLMIVCLFNEDNSATVTPPSGWTNADTISRPNQKQYYKVADSGDVAATDFDFVFSASSFLGGLILRVSGTGITDKILDTTYTDFDLSTTSDTFTGLSVTPEFNDSLLIMSLYRRRASSGPGNWTDFTIGPGTNPTWTEYFDVFNNGAFDVLFGVAAAVQSTSEEITSFGATSGMAADEISGMLTVYSPQRSASGNTALVTPTTTLNEGAGSAGTSGTINMAEATTTTFNIAGKEETDIWTNQTRSSTTWTNQNKS